MFKPSSASICSDNAEKEYWTRVDTGSPCEPTWRDPDDSKSFIVVIFSSNLHRYRCSYVSRRYDVRVFKQLAMPAETQLPGEARLKQPQARHFMLSEHVALYVYRYTGSQMGTSRRTPE